ncbi:MAG: DUF4190 domain-containing protein [Myxococcales bacterium]|nr:DUF4190 domain-containing protein [Myxococcales bacterium]
MTTPGQPPGGNPPGGGMWGPQPGQQAPGQPGMMTPPGAPPGYQPGYQQQPQPNPYGGGGGPGGPGGPYMGGPPKPSGPADGKAIISMIMGIVATVLCCLPLIGPVCGTLGIVFYAKFMRVFRESGETLGGKGMAIAGLVTGIIGAAIGLIYTVYWIIAFFIVGSTASMLPFLK